MKQSSRVLALILCVLVSALLMVACQFSQTGFDEGVAAYEAGDYATALREFKSQAQRGDARAQFFLGEMHMSGKGVPGDSAQAINWYRKAAEQGYPAAQVYLGFLYDLGLLVPEDYAQAANWYRKAAEKGDAKAQFNLGLMYSIGEGVPSNYVEALKWLLIAKANDQPKAENVITIVETRMQREQIAQAQALATEWWNAPHRLKERAILLEAEIIAAEWQKARR